MATNKKLKTYTFDQITNEFIGKKGTPKRDKYEFDLKLELLGEMIRTARKDRNLTQEQLGKIIGVQKAQISKPEKNTNNVKIETVLRVFNALKAKVKFRVELEQKELILS